MYGRGGEERDVRKQEDPLWSSGIEMLEIPDLTSFYGGRHSRSGKHLEGYLISHSQRAH
jgi:hypothetical protein